LKTKPRDTNHCSKPGPTPEPQATGRNDPNDVLSLEDFQPTLHGVGFFLACAALSMALASPDQPFVPCARRIAMEQSHRTKLQKIGLQETRSLTIKLSRLLA
jgi:hypothetical protein